MGARVIGLGQPAAGDDGVGLAILDRIREMGAPAGTMLFEAREATSLIPLLETAEPIVLVDAVVGHGTVGEVLELDAHALGLRPEGPRALSTHGVDVGQAIALARVLSPGAISSRIWLVGVTIARPDRYVHGLSPAVRAAIPRAALAVLTRVSR